MHERYLRVLEVSAHLQRAGITVYSPIVHNHEMARRFHLPKESDFWERHNKAMLIPSLGMFILELPGWETSSGIQKEVRCCHEHNILIRQLPYPLEEIPKI